MLNWPRIPSLLRNPRIHHRRQPLHTNLKQLVSTFARSKVAQFTSVLNVPLFASRPKLCLRHISQSVSVMSLQHVATCRHPYLSADLNFLLHLHISHYADYVTTLTHTVQTINTHRPHVAISVLLVLHSAKGFKLLILKNSNSVTK